jgi:hypothetical protein
MMTSHSRKKHLQTSALAALLMVGLSACGGGGGGSALDNDDVPLTSKADVLREIEVLDDATDFIAASSPPPVVTAPTPGLIAQLLALLGLGGRTTTPDPETPQAAGTTSISCSGGGTLVDDVGNKNRDFPYYSATQISVNFDHATSANCVQTTTADSGATTTVSANGQLESGHSLAGADGPVYNYLVAGNDGTPVTTTISTTSSGTTTTTGPRTLLGTEEDRATDTTKSTAQLVAITYDNGTFNFGQGTTPFMTEQDVSSGALQLTGAYAHTSTSCSGGQAYVTTSTPITSASDDVGTYLTAGAIKIATSGSSATITFFPDGSATYTLANGQTGQITRAEIQQAISARVCS